MTREYIASTSVWAFGIDVLVGSLVVGAVLAVLAAAASYSLVRGSGEDRCSRR